MRIAENLLRRRFPRATESVVTAHKDQIAELDRRIKFMFEGMVGQVYMYGRDIIVDPENDRHSFGTPADVARLFLARGLKTTEGTVVPYDKNNPDIQMALSKLEEEVNAIFYPQMLALESIDEHFEFQKMTVLKFLAEQTEPYPQGHYFSELIAQKYLTNILPLKPMDIYGNPASDHLAVMRRKAFDQLHQTLAPLLEVIDAAAPEPTERTANTQPTGLATAKSKGAKP